MSEKSEEFVGGQPAQLPPEEEDPSELMHQFRSPPPNRKRKQGAGQKNKSIMPPGGSVQEPLAQAAQEGPADSNQKRERRASNTSQHSNPFNLSLTAKKESLKQEVKHAQKPPLQRKLTIDVDEVEVEASAEDRGGSEWAAQDDGRVVDRFASQYEQAMLRVQKSKELQSMNSSLANTSQSGAAGQSIITQGSKRNKFVPSKQRNHSHIGDHGRNLDLQRNQESFHSKRRADGQDGGLLVMDESDGLVAERLAVAAQAEALTNSRQLRNQSMIAQNLPAGPLNSEQNWQMLQHHRRNAGAGSRTMYQPSALTPNAQSGTKSMAFANLNDYGVSRRGQGPLNLSDLVQQQDDRISMSIRNQMQMSLQYAEAQEEEFRQMIRLKRKRVQTLMKQQPPEKEPTGKVDEAKEKESDKDKEGGGPSASAINPKQREEDMDFLLILRQQMVHLQERLKIEIRHKLTLMKHVSSLQQQLKTSKEREAGLQVSQKIGTETMVELSRDGDQQRNAVATQTEAAIDLASYERDLESASRAVRATASALEEPEAKDSGKDISQVFQAQFQQHMVEQADQTQDRGMPENSLMFLEHQGSTSLPYHDVHNNFNNGPNNNDVSDFKAGQQTPDSRLLPDSVVMPDLDAAKEEIQSAARPQMGPPSHSNILQQISEESGFLDHMQHATSGVGSSMQRDDEMSKVLANNLNKTISSGASPPKLRLNETVQNQESSYMNAPAEADANQTVSELFHAGRKEALSFGVGLHPNHPDGATAAPAPAQGNADQEDQPSGTARSQKATESMHQRPSARDKDMNVILESLNETQSQLNEHSVDRGHEEPMLDMQEINQSGKHEASQFFKELVHDMPDRHSEALPAFGGRQTSYALDEEERRKIQMQWRHNIVKNHRRSQMDLHRRNSSEHEEVRGSHSQRTSLQETSLHPGKSSTARDSAPKQKSYAEGSLIHLHDSYSRERTNSYHLIRYTSNQAAQSAQMQADAHKRKRASIQDTELLKAQVRALNNSNQEKPDKDYKLMFQLLLDEKKRQVKNTKELIGKMHELTEEIKVLKQKNKQLSTVINRFGDLDNHFEFPMATAQNMSQAQNQQSLTKFVQDQYDEILQEQIYNQSVNFNLDQKHLQGGGQVNSNADQTVVANKLHQDDRDILIQQFNRGRDSQNEARPSRYRKNANAAATDRQQRTSISPYKYKDPRLSAEKPVLAPRNSGSRYQNRFSANENDTSQSNFANVTQHQGLGQDSIPQTQNIEIRMRNRLQRQNQQSHLNRNAEKSPNSIHYMSQHQRQSIKEKIAQHARANPPQYLQRPQQVAGDDLSFNVDAEESNIMSAGLSSRQKKSIRDINEQQKQMRQQQPTYMGSPLVGDFNSQSAWSGVPSARNALYSKDYQAELLHPQPEGLDKTAAHPLNERPSAESGNTMNHTSVSGERRSDPRQLLTKDQRHKLGSNSKGKKGKSGTGFMSIIKKKLLRSSAKGDPLVDKKQMRKRPSARPADENQELQKQGDKTGRSKGHRDDSNDISARSKSVGAKDEEMYDKFYNFEPADDEEALSVDNSLRLQQSENVPRKGHGLDFKNLAQKNAELGNPSRETYNQRDTLDFEEKISSKKQQKEARKKIKEDSKAARNQFKNQQAHRLSFNPGQYNANQFLQQQVKQAANEEEDHFVDVARGTFNPGEGAALQKQESVNFGGPALRAQNSQLQDDKSQQAERMNLQFGQLGAGSGADAQPLNIFGQQIGGQQQQSFNISAIQRDRDASQLFINHTNISIQNSFFNNASFMGAAGGHQQMAANFGGGPPTTVTSQLGQAPGVFATMNQGAMPRDLGQAPPRGEYPGDYHQHGAASKDQIKEQFLRMSLRGKQPPSTGSANSSMRKAAADQSQQSNAADPRSTSPIEAAMSMRMSMMSNTAGASSRHDASAMGSSLKLQNKQQRRKDPGKETKGLVFQDASKNK